MTSIKFDFKDFEKAARKEAMELAKKNAQLEITCPHCEKAFLAKSGVNRCPHCQSDINLNITIEQ